MPASPTSHCSLTAVRQGAASSKQHTRCGCPLRTATALQQRRELPGLQGSSRHGDSVPPLPQSSHWRPLWWPEHRRQRAVYSSQSPPEHVHALETLPHGPQSQPPQREPPASALGSQWQCGKASASPGRVSHPPWASSSRWCEGGSRSTLSYTPHWSVGSLLRTKGCRCTANRPQNRRQRGGQSPPGQTGVLEPPLCLGGGRGEQTSWGLGLAARRRRRR